MTTQELESKIEGQSESQSLDFKSNMPWSVVCFAKDILAMSNVKDGGYIIIGIEDQTIRRQGIDNKNKETYKIDVMKDQMKKYADPHVDFSLCHPKDKDGLEYIVIQVFPFREIPVICSKDDPKAGTIAGVIYYRNSDRRIESAAVSNAYDMRDIIEYATIKMMQKKREIGFVANLSVEDKLDKELSNL